MIVGKKGFQGGYGGAGNKVNLITDTSVSELDYDEHCNAIPQRVHIEPVGVFNASSQVLIVPSQGFSWLALLPDPRQAIFGWWEHLNR
jgi:hypothetical protein